MFLSDETANHFVSFLAERNIISANELSQVLTAAKEGGKNAVSLLLEFGISDEATLQESVADAFGLEPINLGRESSVSQEALAVLPKKFSVQNRILPFDLVGDVLHVAIADPVSLNQVSSVKTVTGKTVVTYIMTLSQMSWWLTQIGSKGAVDQEMRSGSVGDKPSRISASIKSSNKIDPVKNASEGMAKESEEAKSSEVIHFVNEIIAKAIQLHISDIHLEPYRDNARIRYRLDGVLQAQDDWSKFLFEHYPAITTRIKIMSKLDIAERRLPQDGAITFEMADGREVDIRVSILPTSSGGERVVMRLLDHSAFELKLETLGMHEEDLASLSTAIEAPQGLVLVTGPTGSGKSTTLYACLNKINQDGINIMTAEDPVEYVMEGVGQVQIKEEIGLDFQSALRSFLRQDPEVILVGEIRDKETGDIAIKASLTGHLVLSTLHTNDAISTITRLINMGIPDYLITGALSLIVAQRLARKICRSCAVVDESVTPEQLKMIGFADGEMTYLNVYKGQGCELCNGTGYKGRQGIYEILPITPLLKQAIMDKADVMDLKKIALDDGFTSMQAVGRGFIQQGVLSVHEYQRILIF